jgi:hypothetical protein
MTDTATPSIRVTRYFHRTTADRALQIFKEGFCDGEGSYGTSNVYRGVWLSNVPLDVNEGAEGEVVLTVRLRSDLVSDWEWVEESKGYREFLVPAALINEKHQGLRVVAVDLAGEYYFPSE